MDDLLDVDDENGADLMRAIDSVCSWGQWTVGGINALGIDVGRVDGVQHIVRGKDLLVCISNLDMNKLTIESAR